jgi:hypothetical protein
MPLASKRTKVANLLERRHRELRRILLPRTPEENEHHGSFVQNTMTSEVRFRAELSEYGVERWQLARV